MSKCVYIFFVCILFYGLSCIYTYMYSLQWWSDIEALKNGNINFNRITQTPYIQFSWSQGCSVMSASCSDCVHACLRSERSPSQTSSECQIRSHSVSEDVTNAFTGFPGYRNWDIVRSESDVEINQIWFGNLPMRLQSLQTAARILPGAASRASLKAQISAASGQALITARSHPDGHERRRSLWSRGALSGWQIWPS